MSDLLEALKLAQSRCKDTDTLPPEKTVKIYEWEAAKVDAHSLFRLALTINATEFLDRPAGYWFCFGVDGYQLPDVRRWRLTLKLGLASENPFAVIPGAYQHIDWREHVPEAELLQVID